MKKPTKSADAGSPVRVRMLAVLSGAEPQLGPGDVAEFDAEEAARLVSVGAAVILEDEDEQAAE